MYDASLTNQSLPSENYIRLLGISISVFCSNNSFIIENIIHTNESYSWYNLIDKVSGKLNKAIADTITRNAGNDIQDLFSEIVAMRNRIIHSFRITSKSDEQILSTKEKDTGMQFDITEQYLCDFIHKNQQLSDLLENYRNSLRDNNNEK